MSLNDLVSNTRNALNSALTKWKLFGELKETPKCPQDALPVEKFKNILPPSTDTNGDGCIGVDVNERTGKITNVQKGSPADRVSCVFEVERTQKQGCRMARKVRTLAK